MKQTVHTAEHKHGCEVVGGLSDQLLTGCFHWSTISRESFQHYLLISTTPPKVVWKKQVVIQKQKLP